MYMYDTHKQADIMYVKNMWHWYGHFIELRMWCSIGIKIVTAIMCNMQNFTDKQEESDTDVEIWYSINFIKLCDAVLVFKLWRRSSVTCWVSMTNFILHAYKPCPGRLWAMQKWINKEQRGFSEATEVVK